MRLRSLNLIGAFVVLTLAAFGQAFDLQRDRVPVAELNGLWRFHTGDDQRYAQPDFDDSTWPLLKSNQSWGTQGYPDYSGVAWYRFEMLVPEDLDDPALLVPPVANNDQVYANGKLLCQVGPMPPNAQLVSGPHALLCRIPPMVISRARPLHFAIRVWESRLSRGRGGPTGTTIAGNFGNLKAKYDDQIKRRFWSLSALNIQLLISLLAGVAALALFSLQRSDREYLWFGLFESMSAALAGVQIYAAFYLIPTILSLSLRDAASSAEWIFFLVLVYTLLRQRRDLIFWIAAASAFFQVPVDIVIVLTQALPNWVTVMGAMAWLPFVILVPIQLARGAFKGNRDAALLCVPVGLENLALITLYGLTIAYRGFGYLGIDRFTQVSSWPFPFGVVNVTDGIMQLSILAVLVSRFARTRRDEQRMASEMEAARAVQQVLVPETIPIVPGFTIESVYRPAGQVGGDFFQVLKLPHEATLLAIGDVSGKGMPAAMTVSLIVGTLRTLANYLTSPKEILTALNRCMAGRQNGGFITCLLLRLESDGTATMANAGHLSPYLDGAEVILENGLPLGLSPEESYIESQIHLAFGTRLTLLTDGVAEARNASGEIFGFERTRAITCETANEIAQTAQEFGQEDDITVLSVTRQG